MQGIRYECNLLPTTRALKLMPNYVKDLGYSCRINLDVGSSICGVYNLLWFVFQVLRNY